MEKDKPEPGVAIDRNQISTESSSYLGGLFQELHEQTNKYQRLTQELLNLEARVALAEKTVCLTRDHMSLEIEQSDSSAPNDWAAILNKFRFVGIRLADACMAILKENRKMTPQEILVELNKGMYRFRTSSPLREIHAALLRQSLVTKEDQYWVWTGGEEEQAVTLRPKFDVEGV